MGIPAGLLNRRVTFLRRAPGPAEGDSPRGGYEYTGEAQWGGYRPRNPSLRSPRGIPAGLLTRRVTFRRRARWPTGGDAARGFEQWGEAQWGGFRPSGTKEASIGGLQLQVSTGVLTLRDGRLVA